ncbi:MAG TPA: DUF1583 domain-containing protein, partial [Gemmata sp.]|nr:DUF1583 domain-containing protein [Gemmata sp.]
AGPGGLWFAQDGYLAQGGSDSPALLLFDTPLTGTFEFSVDVFQGTWAEGHAGYAGIIFEPNRTGVASSVWAVGHHDQVFKNAAGLQNETFNRITVQVSPKKVRCLVNGQLFYEDTDPQPTSPWIALYASGGRRPVFRNFTLSGKPEVPAAVKLSDGDSLGGWTTSMFGGIIPGRMTKKEQEQGEGVDQWGRPIQPGSQKEPKYDWEAKNGEILGRKIAGAAGHAIPSLLAYFRPLHAGETLRYEFFHEPGKTHVHPALGRLAFLLEPDGVKLRWLMAGDTAEWTGLRADNRADDPAGKKSDKLPFKVGDWNALALSTTDNGVKIELNGTLVYEGKLPRELERQFGLFHYRDESAVRVRNVVLTGAWPKEPPAAIDFATRPATAAIAKARRWQLGEKYYFTEAGDVVERARKVSPAERYNLLADWVLPVPSRPTFQLAGVSKPLDVLGIADQKEQPKGRRVMLGARLEAPCLELVVAAKEAGKLDELAERIATAETPAADDLFRRSKAALLAVVRAAQGKDTDAEAALKQLLEAAKKMPPDAHAPERWPELIALTGTLDRPALLKTLGELAQVLNENVQQSILQNKPFDNRDWWMREYRAVRARASVAAQPDGVRRPFGSDDVFAHWGAVAGVNAASRSQGWNVPHWSVQDGVVTHFPGHDNDYLFLRTPLRGNFEVTCDLRVTGWAEGHIRYGAHMFELNHDWKQFRMHTNIRHNGRLETIRPPIKPTKENVYKFRMEVKDGWLRAFVEDREIASEKIGETPEPWLCLHGAHATTSWIANLRINGKPTVPTKIDLLANDDLGMWRPYLGQISDGPTRNYDGSSWVKRGEELYEMGRKLEPPPDGKPLPPRSFPESALYYQRPMLEDGAIECDFYYEAGKSLVNPMLDRLVFLLEPDGVKLHWLTDGAADKSGVA